MKNKICVHCKQEKNMKEFYKHTGNKDGLHSWCKKRIIILEMYHIYKIDIRET